MDINTSYLFSLLSTFLLFSMLILSLIKSYKKKEIKKFTFYVFMVLLLVYMLKFSLKFARPSEEFLLFKFDKYSFPSTHASLGGALGLYINTVWSIILAIIIGLLKYYSEAHYMRDIIGGWILSALIYTIIFYDKHIIFRLKKYKRTFMRKGLHIIFGSALLASGIFLYDYFFYVSIIVGIIYLMFVYTPIGKKIYLKVKYPRKGDIDIFSPIYIILGSLISYFLYDRLIFLTSIVFLVYIDALTTIIGKIFPYITLPNGRHLTGSIIGSLIGYLIIYYFLLEKYALISAISFLIYEIIFPNYKKLDDNLIIPIWIGLWITLFERLVV